MFVEVDLDLNSEIYNWIRLELNIPPEKIFAMTPTPNDKDTKTFWWFDFSKDAMAFKLRWG